MYTDFSGHTRFEKMFLPLFERTGLGSVGLFSSLFVNPNIIDNSGDLRLQFAVTPLPDNLNQESPKLSHTAPRQQLVITLGGCLEFKSCDIKIQNSQHKVIIQSGDVLLAEDLSDRLSIKPTDSFGLNIRSGGDGVGRLYFRATEIPTMPPVVLEEMEALGENLKSANIRVHEIGRLTVQIPGYQIIELSDVQGGRIIISARASAEVNGLDIDLRGVLLDAQVTGGVPSGTTLGVNGFASDLSFLNMIPGFSGSTSHWMAPEPVSSGILTAIATFWGMP